MNAMTLREAKQNLEHLVTRVLADAEPTIVVSDSGEKSSWLGWMSTIGGRKRCTCFPLQRMQRICENQSPKPNLAQPRLTSCSTYETRLDNKCLEK